MRLVIDTNCFMAGLLKDSTSRSIILHWDFHFYAPDFLMQEVNKYEDYIKKKAKLTDEQYKQTFYLLLEKVSLVPFEDFRSEFSKAEQIMSDIDIKDSPFIAVGLALNINGIWSEDDDLRKQSVLEVYSTGDLYNIMQN